MVLTILGLDLLFLGNSPHAICIAWVFSVKVCSGLFRYVLQSKGELMLYPWHCSLIHVGVLRLHL